MQPTGWFEILQLLHGNSVPKSELRRNALEESEQKEPLEGGEVKREKLKAVKRKSWRSRGWVMESMRN